ncbi:transferase, chloramphenicol acetyltransferase-like domain protein [Tanacetum coccineum]
MERFILANFELPKRVISLGLVGSQCRVKKQVGEAVVVIECEDAHKEVLAGLQAQEPKKQLKDRVMQDTSKQLQPLHIVERSLPTSSLVTTKRPYASRRLFSANPSVIIQELSIENEIEHKSTGGIRVMSIQNVKPDRPTPDALRSYKLSAFDQIMTPCEHGADKVIDEVRWLGAQMASYDADYYSMSSMCNSGMYEADFGWGTPVWTCFGYLNNDVPLYANGIMLMDTSTGDGIEAWVTLSQDEMAILEGDPDLLLYASVEPSPLQV